MGDTTFALTGLSVRKQSGCSLCLLRHDTNGEVVAKLREPGHPRCLSTLRAAAPRSPLETLAPPSGFHETPLRIAGKSKETCDTRSRHLPVCAAAAPNSCLPHFLLTLPFSPRKTTVERRERLCHPGPRRGSRGAAAHSRVSHTLFPQATQCGEAQLRLPLTRSFTTKRTPST